MEWYCQRFGSLNGASKRYRYCSIAGRDTFAHSRWFTGYVNNKRLSSLSARDSSLSFVELYKMIRDYIKQETLDPLRGVGRWLAWGIVGAIALLFGAVVGLIGLLRLSKQKFLINQIVSHGCRT